MKFGTDVTQLYQHKKIGCGWYLNIKISIIFRTKGTNKKILNGFNHIKKTDGTMKQLLY